MQEECQVVQEECQTTWDAILLAFKTVDPIIDCNDTSTVLFPIPHCCTGAGLGVSLAFLKYLHMYQHNYTRKISS